MRDLREIMGELVGSGLTTKQHLLILELTAAVASNAAPAMKESAEDRRRRLGAERQAKYDAAKRQKASDSDAERQEQIASDRRHKSSESVSSDADPRVRVRDNLPKLVTTGSSVSAASEARAWDRAALDELAEQLRQAAGQAIDLASPALIDLSPITAILAKGQGPPCDLECDVLPAIRAQAARSRPGHAKRWNVFLPAITEARDRRLAGAPATQPIEMANARRSHPAPSAKQAARHDNYERALAGAVRADAARR